MYLLPGTGGTTIFPLVQPPGKCLLQGVGQREDDCSRQIFGRFFEKSVLKPRDISTVTIVPIYYGVVGK